jgi:hypothetical protein
VLPRLAFVLLLQPMLDARPDPSMSGPKTAKTTAEIVACAEKEDVRGGLRREPYVSTAEFRSRDGKAFAAWYNPYSGKAACHVYLYTHDDAKGVWVRRLDHCFPDTPDVSIEFGAAVTIRDVKGAVVHRYEPK